MKKVFKIILIVFKIIVFFAVLFAIGKIFWGYQNAKIKCQEECVYSPTISAFGDFWEVNGRRFETQKQCIDYCVWR